MFRYFSLMMKNSLRNRRRSVLTIGSIAISMCLLGVLVAMYCALFLDTQASPAQALRIIVHHKVSITQPMPISYRASIKQIPGVSDVMVWQWFGGTYKDAGDPRNFFARFAVEPDKLFNIRREVELPEDQKLAFQRFRTACIVDKKLAAKLNWKIGDRVTLIGDIFPVNLELTIAGAYTDPDENETLFFNYEYLRELMKTVGQAVRPDEVGVFQVQANSPDDVPRVVAAIDKAFESAPAPTKSESERAWQLRFISFLGNLKLFLLSVCGALTFTILLVSANTISMSVRERVREVGILKTLGFTPGEILGIILGESTFLAAIGELFGLLLAGGLCFVVHNSGTAFASLKLSVSPIVAVVVMLIAAVIGLLSSFVPAWSASRRSILDSLRSTG